MQLMSRMSLLYTGGIKPFGMAFCLDLLMASYVRGSRAYLISITVQCLSIVLSRSCICTVYLKQICVAGPQNGLEM